MKHAVAIPVLTAVLALTHAGRAQEVNAPVEPGPAPASSAEPDTGATWGWLLIGTSVALGAAMTASGLAVDCDGEKKCRVDTSLLVWGGLGVASAGSMAGFILLERAERSSGTSGVVLTLGGRF